MRLLDPHAHPIRLARLGALCLVQCLLFAACDGDAPDADGGPALDAGSGGRLDAGPGRADAGPDFDGGPDYDAGPMLGVDGGPGGPDAGGGVPDYPADWPRSRGWTWVRNNEPFVSALSVRMGAPPAASVDRYYDDFHATAAHLWQTGMPDNIAGWSAARPGARWLTWVDQFGNSSSNNMFLGGAPRPAGLIGYQVSDEPRDRTRFNEIMAALSRIATEDPEPLRIFNFTYQAAEIEAFLAESCAGGDMDVISYDRYSLGNSQFTTMMMFRQAALDCGVPYWRYMDSYIPEGVVQTPTGMRWDAFSGLLAGFTGHSWFLYNSESGTRSPFFTTPATWGSSLAPGFASAAQINEELIVYGRAQTRLRSTGVGWMAARTIPGVEHPPDGFPLWAPGLGGDSILQSVETAGGATLQDVLFGFFEDRYGDTYVMVMNPNHEGGAFPTSGTRSTRVTLGFDFSTAPGVSTSQLLVLRPTGVVESVAVAGGSVTFPIEAGDLVFYKYDTGRGFEGYR